MKKYLPKILIALALIGSFALSANSALANPPEAVIKFESGCGTDTSSGPLFEEVNFLPGDSKTCWVRATNVSPDKTEKVAIEARNFDGSFPAGDLARALNIEIKNNGATLYGVTSLYNFYIDSGDPLTEDNKEVPLSDLAPGITRQYDITISFPTDKGDYWQGKTTRLDIVWGFQVVREEETEGGGDIFTFINPSGGGVGGYYDETGAKVAGVDTENLDGAHLGNGQAGSVLGETTQNKGDFIEVPDGGSLIAELENCQKIWWWPIGYLIYAILIWLVTLMGSGGKPFKIWRLASQIILVIGSLAWWLFEPCGTLIWWWPVVLVLIFMVAVRWYLNRIANYQTGAGNISNTV